MDRNMMIKLMEENPGAKITHELFGTGEFIYQKDNGYVYDENGYLFEDWYSSGFGRHDGIRMRKGGNWEDGWEIAEKYDICKTLSGSVSGKNYLYNNYCKECQYNRRCCYFQI